VTGDSSRQAGRQTPSALEVIAYAVVFGLGTGLLEVFLRGVQRYGFGSHLFLTRDVLWMAPVADAALFVLAGAGLLLVRAALAALRPGVAHVGYAAMFGTYLAMIPLGPLLMTPRIHGIAAVLLSLGVGVQGGRMLARRTGGMRRVARWAAPVFALLVVAGFLFVRGGQSLGERRGNAGLPDAAAGAPNVLLIILDTVRSKSLSLYGYDKPTTPNLERLAEHGATFESVVSTSPWTLPSHASIFTGRYPHELSADWLTPLDDSDPTLAEHFATRGYRTAGFVGNLIYATWETGLDRGFARYEDFPLSVSTALSTSWLGRWLANRVRRWLGHDEFLVHKSAGDINSEFLDWLDAGQTDAGRTDGGSTRVARPFFAFLNYMEAHGPYIPPDSLSGRFGPERTGRAVADLSVRREWTPEALAAERAAYDGEIAYADQEIGAVVASLEARGLLENTLLIITSDHGEQFGEHGLTDHANSLYRPLLDVPLLVVWYGRVPAGVRFAEPVSLRDLAATISALATGAEDAFPGHSLFRFFESHADMMPASPILSSVSGGVRMPDWVPVSKGDMKSLVSDGYHYIIDGAGSEELFDFATDSGEHTSLAESPAESARLGEMGRSVRELTATGTEAGNAKGGP